ncbi:MAG TPA: hypothetical protein VD846_06005 [Allosphingosinicella sp.]|nr:hypothetical protein [Allosphingosinicella sp.]
MAQDDPEGQTPATRGRSRATTAAISTDTRAINAPPPPEDVGTPPGAADPPAAASDDAAGGNEGGGAGPERTDAPTGAGERDGGGGGSEDRTGQLAEAVEAARNALKEKEEELVRYKAQREADAAEDKLVRDYAGEENALRLADEDLEDYRQAEISFLHRFLDSGTREKIENAARTAQAEIESAGSSVKTQEDIAAARRKERDEAKDEAAKARRRAQELKRPAASIKERLKAASAIRSEARKASDEGKYALAYWLIMPGGRLEQAIKAEPPIWRPEDLRKEVKAARAALEAAEQRLADREEALKAAEELLAREQARLDEKRRGFDAAVLEKVAALNPPIVKVA